MKIIHCGDVHLDSKIESNLPTAKSKQRKSEILLSFCEMADYAVENDVTAVVIAGDLFDTDVISATTRDVVLKKIEECSGVDFLYLCGNHDAGKTLSDNVLPQNLKLFKDSWTTFSYGDVDITGAELNEENCRNIYGSLRLSDDRFNIVTMHGQIGTAYGVDAVNINELADMNIDYLALGHYHTFKKEALGKRGTWCYCGCLEGRGFDECGDKGFVLLEINGKEFDMQFVKRSHRGIFEVACDLSGVSGAGEMLKKISDAVSSIDENSMVKLVLTGSIVPDSGKDVDYFKEWLQNRFWFAKVSDRTTLFIDPKDYMNDISLKGEFIRLCMAKGLPDDVRDRVIECGLNALGKREVR